MLTLTKLLSIPSIDFLLSRLPSAWPTKENSSPSWWRKYGKKIKQEDWLAQAALDLFFHRDPLKTGSAWIIAQLETIDVASQNHKLARDCAIFLRDNDPAPLLKRLRREINVAFMEGEQYGRYVRFYVRVCFMALLQLELLDRRTRDHRSLADVISIWLSQCLHWLSECSLHGQPYTAGLRREFPEHLDACLLSVLRLEPLNLSDKDLGHTPGSMMNGGMPRATGELLGDACRGLRLLDLDPTPPVEQHTVTVIRSKSGVISYFPKLVDRPGRGPILAAVEMNDDRHDPRLWVVTDEHSVLPDPSDRGDNVYVPFPPSHTWGFNLSKRDIMAA